MEFNFHSYCLHISLQVIANMKMVPCFHNQKQYPGDALEKLGQTTNEHKLD